MNELILISFRYAALKKNIPPITATIGSFYFCLELTCKLSMVQYAGIILHCMKSYMHDHADNIVTRNVCHAPLALSLHTREILSPQLHPLHALHRSCCRVINRGR